MNSSALTTSQSCQTLTDWLAFIEQSHPIEQIELGLTRVQTVAARGGLQQLPGIKILLAGTNGKGSVSHMLAAILQTAGYKTGLYTSPHLHEFRERIKVNGEMISKEFLRCLCIRAVLVDRELATIIL